MHNMQTAKEQSKSLFHEVWWRDSRGQ